MFFFLLYFNINLIKIRSPQLCTIFIVAVRGEGGAVYKGYINFCTIIEIIHGNHSIGHIIFVTMYTLLSLELIYPTKLWIP